MMNMFETLDFVGYTVKYSDPPYMVRYPINMYLLLVALDLDENRSRRDIW